MEYYDDYLRGGDPSYDQDATAGEYSFGGGTAQDLAVGAGYPDRSATAPGAIGRSESQPFGASKSPYDAYSKPSYGEHGGGALDSAFDKLNLGPRGGQLDTYGDSYHAPVTEPSKDPFGAPSSAINPSYVESRENPYAGDVGHATGYDTLPSGAAHTPDLGYGSAQETFYPSAPGELGAGYSTAQDSLYPTASGKRDSLDGFGLSSPLTDEANLPDSFDLDQSYRGPRDSFGTVAYDPESPYGNDGLGYDSHLPSTGSGYEAHDAVNDAFGNSASDPHAYGSSYNTGRELAPFDSGRTQDRGTYDLHQPTYGTDTYGTGGATPRDTYADLHPSAYDPRSTAAEASRYGVADPYSSSYAPRSTGADAGQFDVGGTPYGSNAYDYQDHYPYRPHSGTSNPYAPQHQAAYSPYVGAEPNNFASSRVRTEEPKGHSAFSSYMDRQDPYDPLGYENALVPRRSEALSADATLGRSLAAHPTSDPFDTQYSSRPNTDLDYHSRDYAQPQVTSYTQSPNDTLQPSRELYEPGGATTYDQTTYDVQRTDQLEPAYTSEAVLPATYDYGAYSWSGKLDNDAERYEDLQHYQQTLLDNAALDDASRQRAWRERLEWEELDNEARREKWRQLDDRARWNLGLAQGYWGSALEQDPLFYQRSVAPWAETGYVRPNEHFHIEHNHPVYNTYNHYYSPSYAQQDQHHIDDKMMEAADLAAYSNALARDYSIQQEERRRRWEDRLAWEALNQRDRAERWRAMAEEERMRLGLGPHSYHSFHTGVSAKPERFFPHLERLQQPQYSMPPELRQRYAPFIDRPASPSVFRQPNWELAAAYFDLLRYENELRHARNLSEAQRQKLWRQRLAWQQLNEAQRQIRWLRMKQRERQLLGLDPKRFMGSRYASLGAGYRPGLVRPVGAPAPTSQLALEMPQDLRRRFKPYQGRSFRITNNPSWITSAMPGAKDTRQQLAQQQRRKAEANRRQAQLHRLEAEKLRAKEMEASELKRQLAMGV